MNILPRKEIPDDILKDSVLAHIAAAYFSVGKRLERKTQCSATRGLYPVDIAWGTKLNQNQIATLWVSTGRSCTGLSSHWPRKDSCRSTGRNRAEQSESG